MLGVHTQETLLKRCTSTFPDEPPHTENYTTESSESKRPDSSDIRQRGGSGDIKRWERQTEQKSSIVLVFACCSNCWVSRAAVKRVGRTSGEAGVGGSDGGARLGHKQAERRAACQRCRVGCLHSSCRTLSRLQTEAQKCGMNWSLRLWLAHFQKRFG